MTFPPHEPEGATTLTVEELEEVRFKHIQIRSQLDALEQANIQQGLLWLKRQKKADLLTEQFVRQLHKKLFGEVWRWAGAFRTTGKNIGVSAVMIPIELRNLLDDVRYWIEFSTYPANELAVRFHHRLVAIHPFPNGNGRHARIMADAVLMHLIGAPAIDWSGGQDLQRTNNRRCLYIHALRKADQGDYGALIAMVK